MKYFSKMGFNLDLFEIDWTTKYKYPINMVKFSEKIYPELQKNSDKSISIKKIFSQIK